jgi:hypothetical protein
MKYSASVPPPGRRRSGDAARIANMPYSGLSTAGHVATT